MRKIISGLLILVLCTAFLSGCSKEEINYLNLTREMSALESAQDVGRLDIELGEAWVREKVKLSVDYRMNMAVDYFDLNLAVTYNGTKAGNIDVIYDFQKTDSIYISAKGVLDLIPLYEKLGFRVSKDVKEALKDKDYIVVDMSANDNQDFVDYKRNFKNRSQVSKYLYDFLEMAFGQFSTGVVSEKDGEYKISLNNQQIYELFKNTVNYISQDPERFYSQFLKFIKKTYLYPQNIIDALEAQDKAFRYNMNTLNQSLEQSEPYTLEYLSMLEGTKFESSLKKESGKYVQTTNFVLKYSNDVVLKLTDKNTMTPGKVTPKEITGNFFDYNELLEIMYHKGKFESMDIYLNRSEPEGTPYVHASYENGYDGGYVDYFNSDNSLYVSLPSICRLMGEEVELDEENKTAHFTVNDAKIQMPVIMKDGNAFVKLRDFEKLGYTVDYHVKYRAKHEEEYEEDYDEDYEADYDEDYEADYYEEYAIVTVYKS